MLRKIMWRWSEDPSHVLCTIPECEEEQVALDVEAEADSNERMLFSGAGH